MKRLYMIGGTMGVGKTATCQELKKRLDNCVFLDGDWCWDMSPFQVTPETKRMVLGNIIFLLNSFIHCSAYENVIFCWVMHEQKIIDDILSGIDTEECQVNVISLICSPEALRQRLQKDVRAGVRTEDAIAKSLDRLPLYERLDTVKIDVSLLSLEQAAAQVAKISKREGAKEYPAMETEDLRLGKAKFEDWKAMYHNVWSRPEAARYMAWRVSASEEDARERIRRTIAYGKTHDTWVVYEKESSQAVGFAGVEEIRPHIFQETGIALGPEYTGRGYGKQILKLLLEYGISRGGKEFYYSTRAENMASRALALSCGFSLHASERKTDWRGRGPYEYMIYRKQM